MPVNDNGNEVLRKSAEDIGTGSYRLRVFGGSGFDVNPNAKYVEATYTNSDQTVTYSYYDTSAKGTAYEVYTVNYSEPQDTSFTSLEVS